MSVDPHKIYFVLIDKASDRPVCMFESAREASVYIRPLIKLSGQNVVQIERVYLDVYAGFSQRFLMTFLDRPSQVSWDDAKASGKVKITGAPKLIRVDTTRRPPITILEDRTNRSSRIERILRKHNIT